MKISKTGTTLRCFLVIMMIFMFSVIAYSQELTELPTYKGKKILIVYYSQYNSTHQVASHIHSILGGDMFRIELVNPYPKDYDETVAQARRERGVSLPELKSKVNNLSAYDIIFIGTPVWGTTISPPVMQLLAQHNFAEKTIIPFCTYSLGAGNTFQAMQRSAPQARLLAGFSVLGTDASNAKSNIYEWLSNLK